VGCRTGRCVTDTHGRQPKTVAVAFAETFIGTDHDDFNAWAREIREYRRERAYDPPRVMLYDGNWVYRGTVYGELGGSVNIIVNETGTIQLRLPIDLDDPRRTWAAFWALDEEGAAPATFTSAWK
jgi:hypothetical protein